MNNFNIKIFLNFIYFCKLYIIQTCHIILCNILYKLYKCIKTPQIITLDLRNVTTTLTLLNDVQTVSFLSELGENFPLSPKSRIHEQYAPTGVRQNLLAEQGTFKVKKYKPVFSYLTSYLFLYLYMFLISKWHLFLQCLTLGYIA